MYLLYFGNCRFSSKNSFLDHVNRRAMLLKYKCISCSDENLTFYNPCSFLLHTREHYTLLLGQIDLDNLEISTLPIGLAGFLPDPNIPMMYDVQDDDLGTTTFINSRFYSPLKGTMGKKVIMISFSIIT